MSSVKFYAKSLLHVVKKVRNDEKWKNELFLCAHSETFEMNAFKYFSGNGE